MPSKWVYLGRAEDSEFCYGEFTMVNYNKQVQRTRECRFLLQRERRRWGRAVWNETQFKVVGTYWVKCSSFSLAGWLLGKEQNLPSSSWAGKLSFFLLGKINCNKWYMGKALHPELPSPSMNEVFLHTFSQGYKVFLHLMPLLWMLLTIYS